MAGRLILPARGGGGGPSERVNVSARSKLISIQSLQIALSAGQGGAVGGAGARFCARRPRPVVVALCPVGDIGRRGREISQTSCPLAPEGRRQPALAGGGGHWPACRTGTSVAAGPSGVQRERCFLFHCGARSLHNLDSSAIDHSRNLAACRRRARSRPSSGRPFCPLDVAARRSPDARDNLDDGGGPARPTRGPHPKQTSFSKAGAHSMSAVMIDSLRRRGPRAKRAKITACNMPGRRRQRRRTSHKTNPRFALEDNHR
jgi:hypothetical protein